MRVWGFNKPRIAKNARRIKANTFGFYSLNGSSLVDFPEDSKKEDVCLFLEQVRERSPKGRIIMLIDTFRSHHTFDALEYAEMLDICPAFLPPYSPDLNPIEYTWNTYTILSKKLSYASAWIDQFLTPLNISIKS